MGTLVLRIRFPKTIKEWLVTIVSALVGVFFGGAIVHATQALLRRYL